MLGQRHLIQTSDETAEEGTVYTRASECTRGGQRKGRQGCGGVRSLLGLWGSMCRRLEVERFGQCDWSVCVKGGDLI